MATYTYGDDAADAEVGAETADGATKGGHAVTLCSGESMEVRTSQEKAWFERTRDAYRKENKLTETTDLQDLDRLLVLELMNFRWSLHLARGRDYDGEPIFEEVLRKQINDQSVAIAKVKASLGLDKATRDKAMGEGSFASWLETVKQRALAFGIHRQNQVHKALALINEISATVGAFDRSNDEERQKLGYKTEKDIVDWIRSDVLPAYHALDEKFLEEQKLWTRDL